MGSDYRRRTAITRLQVSAEQAELLEDTISEWQRGANLASLIGWRTTDVSKARLQSRAYDRVREQTRLGSQHAILAIHQASSALSTVQEQQRQGRPASRPEFTAPTVKYDTRSMSLFDDEVTLATTDGRIRCELALPQSEDGYQFRFLDSDEWEVTESTLTARDGDYFLHLGFRKPTLNREISTAEDRTVLGVDLGITNLAVTSTAHFESGRQLIHKHREFKRVRKELQQTGTESSRRTLVGRGERESRYTTNELHRISKRIVDEALDFECDCIALEDLTYIRDSSPRQWIFHEWAHRQLVKYIQYKAEERGIDVVFVEPRDTSRRCYDCGHISERNRPDRDHFSCEGCGSSANADYNAAKNIGWKYVHRGPQSSRWTGDCQLALKSGTVTSNREFLPYSEMES